MLPQLQGYDLNVGYTLGKAMLIADTLSQAVLLSRAVTQNQHAGMDDLNDEKLIRAMEPTGAMSAEVLEHLREATLKEDVPQLLQEVHS